MRDAADEEFGVGRLGEFLLERAPVENSDQGAADFADGLLDRLAVFSGRPAGQDPDDDVTLLAVHFNGG